MVASAALALLLGAAVRADEPATALPTEELGITCDRTCLIAVMRPVPRGDERAGAIRQHSPLSPAGRAH